MLKQRDSRSRREKLRKLRTCAGVKVSEVILEVVVAGWEEKQQYETVNTKQHTATFYGPPFFLKSTGRKIQLTKRDIAACLSACEFGCVFGSCVVIALGIVVSVMMMMMMVVLVVAGHDHLRSLVAEQVELKNEKEER